ncbi:hypothetical protein [Sphingobacterium chungjuense]|uniref:hypothetical protein n=1 Tax=Sphingobacterium chungjuense TaxID=2675553 RepID=UPI0014073ADF|nr:hypothetical protein [Sphingobacterium chungjuense]
MQYTNEECVEFLQRIIAANKNRIEHYTYMSQYLDTDRDTDLLLLFEKYIQQSQQFKAQLTPMIYREGDTEQTGDHKILNASTNTLSQPSRSNIVEACKQLEIEVKQVYNDIHLFNAIMEDQIKELIISQSELLKSNSDDTTSSV